MADVAEEGCLCGVQFGQPGICCPQSIERQRELVAALNDFALHLAIATLQFLTLLTGAYQAGDILDTVDDVSHLSVSRKHWHILRAPVLFRERAIRTGDIVLLHSHGIGLACGKNPVQRGTQIASAGGLRVIGIVGKYLEQTLSERIASSVRGAQTGLGGGHHGVARRIRQQHQHHVW